MKTLVLLMLVFFNHFALADESQYWTSVATEKKIDDKWYLNAEILYRHSQEVEDFTTFSSRLGFSYKIRDALKFSYFLENRNTDNSNNDEVRNIFQLAYGKELDELKLSARTRWELRRFSDSKQWMNRFRLFARAEASKFSLFSWSPFISTEVFYIANQVGSREVGLRETRSQIGMTKAWPDFKLDISYLDRRTLAKSDQLSGDTESRYHILNLSFKYDW